MMMTSRDIVTLFCIICVSLIYTSQTGWWWQKRTIIRYKAQTCTGNGFVGGCSEIFGLTGEPEGLKEIIGSPNVANVCEGDLLAVVHDCDNRIPLYVTVQLNRTEIDASNSGRCKSKSCKFKPSPQLGTQFQAAKNDYSGLNYRRPCYERRADGKLYRDMFWLDDAKQDDPCLPSEPPTKTSRGHMIADSYIRVGGNTTKAATYRFTNCIPQFQKFNSEAWNIAEEPVFPWAQKQCGSAIADPTVRHNAKFHLIVGAVPSTNVTRTFNKTNISPRWFGNWGFGDEVFNATIDYNGTSPATTAAYRVNMPAAMFTAGCCVATDANDSVVWVRHMAFGRDAKPVGKAKAVTEGMWRDVIAQMLPEYNTSGVNLFPSEPLCGNPATYMALNINKSSF